MHLTVPSSPTPGSPAPPLRPGRVEAAAVAWDRSGARANATGKGAVDRARRRGIARGGIGLAAAAVLFAIGWQVMALVAGGIALTTAVMAAASPGGAYAWIERAVDALVVGVGHALTWLTMVPVFWLFFVPYGRLARRGDADPMKRAFAPGQPSYWTDRSAVRRDYLRQF